ncbi:MAG: glycoside hydrolase family 31 protein [Lentisphaerae bacterium]|nr:glycoside hydrolase family 31 protein [Lentisphaerota bacterium]
MHNLIDTRGFEFLQRAGVVERTPTGVRLAVDREILRVDVLRADILRLKISVAGMFDEQPTHAACFSPGPVPAFEVAETADTITVRTSACVLRIARQSFAIDIERPDGSRIMRSARRGDGGSEAYGALNDRFVVARQCEPEDAILGLGEKTGPFDRAGHSYVLWNQDIYSAPCAETAALPAGAPEKDPCGTAYEPYYVSIPFFYHVDGKADGQPAAGFFIDNGYKGYFDFTRHGVKIAFFGGQYTEYIFAGPSLAAILEGYTWVTGRMALPPLWSLGYHQCRWFNYTRDTFMEMVRTYRAKHIPCDVAWLDIDYMNGFRVFTWDTQKFPDVAGMLEELRVLGLRVITIIDPGVKAERGYAVFDQGVAEHLFCRTPAGRLFLSDVWPGRTAFPDFSTPAARAWWGRLNAAHVRSGLDGIWNDMNEPALFPAPNVDMQEMGFAGVDGGCHPHAQYHNQYALLMAMGTVEGLRAALPGRRTFVLSRAGFAGIQRYAANWMGDNCSRWEHLAMSLPMAAAFGLSGQPFVGADIGGFNEPCHGELLARWMQYGALTPFCRNHNAAGQPDQYPWTFGPLIEAICREAIQLRYRLLPYVYSAFVLSAETGAPVQRPLVFDYQADRRARDIEDQYLFGPALLVAPVLRAGDTRRSVYLPAGTWIDWYTGASITGPRQIVAEAPLERIPLYARGGAVVPMLPDVPETTQGLRPVQLDLHVFLPAEDGVFTSRLQEDDGLTDAHAAGASVRTRITLVRSGRQLTLTARRDGGTGFPEFARERFRVIVHGASADATWMLDGRAVTPERQALTFANRGDAFTLVIA